MQRKTRLMAAAASLASLALIGSMTLRSFALSPTEQPQVQAIKTDCQSIIDTATTMVQSNPKRNAILAKAQDCLVQANDLLTPPTTTTPPPTSPPPVDTQPAFPIRAAFTYPWFPETWGNLSNPNTHYTPTAGFYDSSNTTVAHAQVQEMLYANIEAGISSWWGQGTPTDGRTETQLRAADGTPFRWTLYYEKEGSSNPSSSEISNDLTYIKSHYGSDPNYLRVNGKPVIFVYADGTDGCGMADRWKTGNTTGFYVVLKVFSGYRTCASQPNSWHQYGPATPIQTHLPESSVVSPGFWHYNSSTPLLNRDKARFAQNVKDQIASGATWQLITTFNEWGEGTAIEPATSWGNDYLDILHNNGVVVPPTSPPPTSPPPTSPPPTSPPPTSPPPSGRHYVFIWMENKETTSITSSSAPFMTSFAANGTKFSNFYGVSHPSLPNYLAFASGSTAGKGGTDSIRPGEINLNNVWNQLTGAGISWKAYQEDMPSSTPPCAGRSYTGTDSGRYALKHNPATPFSNVFNSAQCANVVPLTQLNFSSPSLPSVSFITPNLCNDMHDCSVATGDNWLKARVPALLNAGATVVITFDEGSTGTNGGGHIWTALDGPGINGSTVSTTFNHYSALRAIEDKYGLARLGGAANANPLPIG